MRDSCFETATIYVYPVLMTSYVWKLFVLKLSNLDLSVQVFFGNYAICVYSVILTSSVWKDISFEFRYTTICHFATDVIQNIFNFDQNIQLTRILCTSCAL